MIVTFCTVVFGYVVRKPPMPEMSTGSLVSVASTASMTMLRTTHWVLVGWAVLPLMYSPVESYSPGRSDCAGDCAKTPLMSCRYRLWNWRPSWPSEVYQKTMPIPACLTSRSETVQ